MALIIVCDDSRRANHSRCVLSARGRRRRQADPVERGTLRLHYVQKPIGYERYEVTRDGDALALTSDFDFTDRGGRVQLAATLRTTADFTPLSFTAKGKSYRFVNVDSDVRIDGSDAMVRADGAESRVTLTATFYTVDGYAPFAAQMLLLRYWKQHGQPRVLRTVPGLPANDVFIEARGREAIRVGSTVVRSSRYVDRRRRLGTGNAVARRARLAGRGDHARRRPELRGGARGSRAGARRLRRARDARSHRRSRSDHPRACRR